MPIFVFNFNCFHWTALIERLYNKIYMKFVNDDVAKSIAICFNCHVLQLRYTHVY